MLLLTFKKLYFKGVCGLKVGVKSPAIPTADYSTLAYSHVENQTHAFSELLSLKMFFLKKMNVLSVAAGECEKPQVL